MNFNRRDFIKAGAIAAGGVAAGFRSLGFGRPEPDFVWSSLVHLGMNMWSEKNSADHVRFDEELWAETSAKFAASGVNQIVLDLGEGVVYPSHPELAVKGSWSVEKLRAEIARLRGMGFEVIPKVNFSTNHDLWLGEYHKMVSSPTYYKVCADLVKDVAEMFDRPRFIHLGYDEENDIIAKAGGIQFEILRQGDLWWHDFLWFVKQVEQAGSRAWIWSDYSRKHPDEFRRRMPKTVLQSPWEYSNPIHPFGQWTVQVYLDLAKWGYDVVPCGSNCYNNDDNFEQNVSYCKANLPAACVKGFIHAPWRSMEPHYVDKYGVNSRKRWLDSADQIAQARAVWEA